MLNELGGYTALLRTSTEGRKEKRREQDRTEERKTEESRREYRT